MKTLLLFSASPKFWFCFQETPNNEQLSRKEELTEKLKTSNDVLIKTQLLVAATKGFYTPPKTGNFEAPKPKTLLNLARENSHIAEDVMGEMLRRIDEGGVNADNYRLIYDAFSDTIHIGSKLAWFQTQKKYKPTEISEQYELLMKAFRKKIDSTLASETKISATDLGASGAKAYPGYFINQIKGFIRVEEADIGVNLLSTVSQIISNLGDDLLWEVCKHISSLPDQQDGENYKAVKEVFFTSLAPSNITEFGTRFAAAVSDETVKLVEIVNNLSIAEKRNEALEAKKRDYQRANEVFDQLVISGENTSSRVFNDLLVNGKVYKTSEDVAAAGFGTITDVELTYMYAQVYKRATASVTEGGFRIFAQQYRKNNDFLTVDHAEDLNVFDVMENTKKSDDYLSREDLGAIVSALKEKKIDTCKMEAKDVTEPLIGVEFKGVWMMIDPSLVQMTETQIKIKNDDANSPGKKQSFVYDENGVPELLIESSRKGITMRPVVSFTKKNPTTEDYTDFISEYRRIKDSGKDKTLEVMGAITDLVGTLATTVTQLSTGASATMNSVNNMRMLRTQFQSLENTSDRDQAKEEMRTLYDQYHAALSNQYNQLSVSNLPIGILTVTLGAILDQVSLAGTYEGAIQLAISTELNAIINSTNSAISAAQKNLAKSILTNYQNMLSLKLMINQP